MWSNVGKALHQIVKITTSMDRWTARLALGNVKINCRDQDIDEERPAKKEKVIIDYWEQFGILKQINTRCFQSTKFQLTFSLSLGYQLHSW